ncbi:unnamed protein product [Acanthoscelides obtectus]|uniref:Ubiquitin carboxyl-terminal hydrolase 47 n=1 Tax=Acanthoscelides obtectus TaxID=200917 RepID=A0A9P0LQF0_ACAOB|nr:unnamed protein product [Acanthoscelides obtectus]CAK1638716.1 Ubiquitin carboxyl-terminal hydrolase 47 [Acanthoscelides obtectus]
MSLLPNEDERTVQIVDRISFDPTKSVRIKISSTKLIDDIFKEVSSKFDHTPDEIELTLKTSMHGFSMEFALSQKRSKTLGDFSVWASLEKMVIWMERSNKIPAVDNSQALVPVNTVAPDPAAAATAAVEDDLLLGASASPTATAGGSSGTAEEAYGRNHADAACNYVGLVNQAMTCYLNSLLQALYMTPEFRNALYNWEFDGQNESRSIPYQLQKLFLNLQTSHRSAVETTDLTTSFGWQGSDAWHQHDIQELCRVMFDALEQKFKDTKQANLINDLYEGKMLDYVKCLECGTEKSREDTFLDIPLPVRPFGSTVAYNSVEEALRAFVQPETLDGNNQYHCEKCNKKCDAHKGLKFTKFPYLLTMHLKRFDFDYSTMHRIKLNDKVVFSEILNLNSFIINHRVDTDPTEERESIVKCDDCSTTDSGSADDESCQGTDASSTANGHDNCADSDEGIDVSSGNNHDEDAKGPYVYELFSIMIHSGSASGGHYYAYIKDFDKNLWFCFNDQSVSGITEDDIRKTYGGGPQRGYYSGAYSSSTNAYMLMYRQIDKDRNCKAITVDEFPPHIKKLLQDMRRKEEEDRINKEKENEMIKLTVYGGHPNKSCTDIKISVFIDSTLAEATQEAYQRFKMEGAVNLEDCRLVVFNRKQECIDCSFDSSDLKFCDIMHNSQQINIFTDWLLEIKPPGAPWMTYNTGGINMKVYPIIMENEEVEEPKLVRVDVGDKVCKLKLKLSALLNIDPSTVHVVMEMYSNEPKYLENDDDIIKFDANCNDYKLYVATVLDEDPEKTFQQSRLRKVIEHYSYIISLNVVLPETDIGTLESLSIPSLDLNQNLDKLELGGGDRGSSSPNLRVSPQPGVSDGFGDQSNSEDSSLSDSDRTLVGDAPGECLGIVSSNSNSPAVEQRTASPGGDPCEDGYNYDALGQPGLEDMSWDDLESVQDPAASQRCENYYFKVTSVMHNRDANAADNRYMRCCRVLADKKMTLERFKKHLEGILRVPSEYFKIFRQYPNSDDEWSCLSDTLRSAKDGERLIVKLGRVLRKDEIKCSVYYLKPDCMDMNNFLFEHIIAKGQPVHQVKKEILFAAKKQHMLDIPYNKCRLREKSWKRPRKIFLDDQKFYRDSPPLMDLFLQELNDVETVTSNDQLVLFVRQWCPSTLTLKPFQEVVLDNSTMEELKSKISTLSGIPVENVDVAYIKAAIPCDMHLLDIHNALEWNPNMTHLEERTFAMRSNAIADDGSVFYFRDNREAIKELTPEERRDLNQKENMRLGRLNVKSYSPGRERALKIYLDTSPSKSDDNLD